MNVVQIIKENFQNLMNFENFIGWIIGFYSIYFPLKMTNRLEQPRESGRCISANKC
jgi:hypothetical protein